MKRRIEMQAQAMAKSQDTPEQARLSRQARGVEMGSAACLHHTLPRGV
jgi:hypothetical protein